MKPRLLIIINRFVIGGQASDTIPLLYHLQDRFSIQVLYGEREADEIEPLFLLEQYPGLAIEKIPSLKRTINPFADFVTLFRIYKFIRKYKPSIVHTHGAKSGLLGRLAAYFSRVPIIIHTFHGHLFHSYFNRFTTNIILIIERMLAQVTDAAIALSPSQKFELTEKYKVFPSNKVNVIPLGIEIHQSSDNRLPFLRKQYQLNQDDILVAIIGRIVPIKNHIDFLKVAVDILKKDVTNCKFFIIGDGHPRDQLHNYLQENYISFSTPDKPEPNAKIIFTSWLSNIAQVIEEVDVVVLTSLNEGTPVSLIEAQLCGKPVVAYNVGGVKDTVLDEQSGFLVEKGDTRTFSKKLQSLIGNREKRKQMGERGKQFCMQKFSKQAEVNAVSDLYNRLLEKKGIRA